MADLCSGELSRSEAGADVGPRLPCSIAPDAFGLPSRVTGCLPRTRAILSLRTSLSHALEGAGRNDTDKPTARQLKCSDFVAAKCHVARQHASGRPIRSLTTRAPRTSAGITLRRDAQRLSRRGPFGRNRSVPRAGARLPLHSIACRFGEKCLKNTDFGAGAELERQTSSILRSDASSVP